MTSKLGGIVLAGLVTMGGAAIADQQMEDMNNMDKPGASTQAAVHKATGVVKNVKPDKGQVTLQHGPVPSLNCGGIGRTM